MEYLTYCFVFAGMLLMGTLCTLLYLPDFKMYRIVKRTYGSGNIQFDVEYQIMIEIAESSLQILGSELFHQITRTSNEKR